MVATVTAPAFRVDAKEKPPARLGGVVLAAILRYFRREP